MLEFPNNLKYLRLKRGWGLKEITENLNIRGTTWSNYETGNSKPNLDDFIRIAKLFGVSETDLLHNESLRGDNDTTEKHQKREPKREPNGKPNDDFLTMLSDSKSPYGLVELLKSKDETIASLKELIDTQKALIQGYKARLKEK